MSALKKNMCIRGIIDTKNNIQLIIFNENYDPHFLFVVLMVNFISKLMELGQWQGFISFDHYK